MAYNTQPAGALPGSDSTRPNTGRERYTGPMFGKAAKAVLITLPVVVIALGVLLGGWSGVGGGIVAAVMADFLVAALTVRS